LDLTEITGNILLRMIKGKNFKAYRLISPKIFLDLTKEIASLKTHLECNGRIK
jgi:hypothetical protein